MEPDNHLLVHTHTRTHLHIYIKVDIALKLNSYIIYIHGKWKNKSISLDEVLIFIVVFDLAIFIFSKIFHLYYFI